MKERYQQEDDFFMYNAQTYDARWVLFDKNSKGEQYKILNSTISKKIIIKLLQLYF